MLGKTLESDKGTWVTQAHVMDEKVTAMAATKKKKRKEKLVQETNVEPSCSLYGSLTGNCRIRSHSYEGPRWRIPH